MRKLLVNEFMKLWVSLLLKKGSGRQPNTIIISFWRKKRRRDLLYPSIGFAI